MNIRSLDALKAEIERDLAELRARMEEPQTVQLYGDVYLELVPDDHHRPTRVAVCHRHLGWVNVDYTEDGLALQVFDNQGLEPVADYDFDVGYLTEE